MTFPISRVDHRKLPARWTGDVVVCDIDRTYLYTRFSSLRGMARIPVEFAIDKRAISGMVPLLKELRRGPEPTSRHTPLYFLSASPAQMRPVIERKMLMDGVEHDGTTFKDWVGVLRRARPSRLREQIGFKLTALLLGRTELPRGAREVLIGDDLESDPLSYTLYADVLSGRVSTDALASRLMDLGVLESDAWAIVDLRRLLPEMEGVRRAYIRLERHDDPGVYRELHPGLVACRDPFQMAMSMWAEGLIGLPGVVRVARELAGQALRTEGLDDRFFDAVRRQLVSPDRASKLLHELGRARLVDADLDVPAPDPAWAVDHPNSR